MPRPRRLTYWLRRAELTKFRKLLYDQLCELTGGPCTYRGRNMFEAHKKLNATNAPFNALAEDLYIAFDRQACHTGCRTR